MNGKVAKKLRRMARHIVTGPMKAKASDGYNEYNQAMNCLGWTAQLDGDGLPMKDPDGQFLKTIEKRPGTITCAWKVRVMYKALKGQWKAAPHNRKVK
jgi:hypothetical protein